jgi:hypothetical protein
LENLLSKGKIDTQNFRLSFIGWLDGYFLKGDYLDKVLDFPGYLDHQDSLKRLVDSDVLLLIIPSERGPTHYPGKIFEYLSLEKPILAIVPPESVTAQLILDSHAGMVVDPENIEEISAGILAFYYAWQKGTLKVDVDQNLVNRFDRKVLTGQLAEILNHLSS